MVSASTSEAELPVNCLYLLVKSKHSISNADPLVRKIRQTIIMCLSAKKKSHISGVFLARVGDMMPMQHISTMGKSVDASVDQSSSIFPYKVVHKKELSGYLTAALTVVITT